MQFEKVEWKRGMEITPATFECLDQYHISRVATAWRLLSTIGFGCMPGYEIKSSVTTNGLIEFEVYNLQALTKSGNVISVASFADSVKCSDFDGKRCYITIYPEGDEQISYNGVALIHEKHKIKACSLSEIDGDSIPLAKITNSQGHCSIDNEYVLPCLTIGSSKVLGNLLNGIWQSLDQITEVLKIKFNVDIPVSIQLLFMEKNEIPHSSTPENVYVYLKKIVTALSLMLPGSAKIDQPSGFMMYNNYDFRLCIEGFLLYLRNYEESINKVQVITNKEEQPPRRKAFVIHV